MSDFHILESRSASQPYLTDRGARGMAVSIVFTILAMFFVIARLYTRIWLMKRAEANDWLILVALVGSSHRALCRGTSLEANDIS